MRKLKTSKTKTDNNKLTKKKKKRTEMKQSAKINNKTTKKGLPLTYALMKFLEGIHKSSKMRKVHLYQQLP